MAARVRQAGVRVQEVLHIEVDRGDEDELRKDPAGFVKKALEGQGHKVNKVVGDNEEIIQAIISPTMRRGAWFHTVWDANDPGDVCVWHYYTY